MFVPRKHKAVRRYPEAQAQARVVLGTDSVNAEAHNNLAIALFNLGRVEEAIAHFREAARINPAWEEAQRNLQRALEAGGK